jgi:hypothetical protein
MKLLKGMIFFLMFSAMCISYADQVQSDNCGRRPRMSDECGNRPRMCDECGNRPH